MDGDNSYRMFVKNSSHVVAVVIGTRVCSVAPIQMTIVTSRLEQWEVIDTSVIASSLWRHSFDGFACTVKLTLQTKRHLYSNSLGRNTNRNLLMDWKDRDQTQQVSLCPQFNTIRAISVVSLRREWQCSMAFHDQDGHDAKFNENCAARFSVKISTICEFRIKKVTMTRLLGRCLWSILGLSVNDYVKTLSSLGFWIQSSWAHSSWALGYFTTKVLATPAIIP